MKKKQSQVYWNQWKGDVKKIADDVSTMFVKHFFQGNCWRVNKKAPGNGSWNWLLLLKIERVNANSKICWWTVGWANYGKLYTFLFNVICMICMTSVWFRNIPNVFNLNSSFCEKIWNGIKEDSWPQVLTEEPETTESNNPWRKNIITLCFSANHSSIILSWRRVNLPDQHWKKSKLCTDLSFRVRPLRRRYTQLRQHSAIINF